MPKVERGGKRLVGGSYHKYGRDLKYGDEYRTIKHFKVDGYDIKAIVHNFKNEADKPLETATPNRVYVTFKHNKEGEDIKSIIYYDEQGRRSKQIDFGHSHKGAKDGHIHIGYEHNEDNWEPLTDKDRQFVAKIKKKLYN